MFVAQYVAEQISPKTGGRTPKRYVKSDALKIFLLLSKFDGLNAIKLSERQSWEVIEEKLMSRGLYPLLSGPSLSLLKDQGFFTDLEALHLKHFGANQVNFNVPATPPRNVNVNKVVPRAPRKPRVSPHQNGNGNEYRPRASRNLLFSQPQDRRNHNNLPLTPSLGGLPAGNANNRLEFSIAEEDPHDAARPVLPLSQDSPNAASNNNSMIDSVVTNFSNVVNRILPGSSSAANSAEPRQQVPQFHFENEDEDQDMVPKTDGNMLRLNYQHEDDACAQPLALLENENENQWVPLELHQIQPGMKVKHSNPENLEFSSGDDEVDRVTEKKVKIVGRGFYYPTNLLFLNVDA